MRALAYVTAASLDYAQRHPDEKVRKEHKAFVELMIPVVKGWCTENAVELCSTALQVFGGMGYIEETGIAQQYRDVRIITIYEGTTGIQALDLIGRKLLRDMGARQRPWERRWRRRQRVRRCTPIPPSSASERRWKGARDAQRDLAVDRHERDGRLNRGLCLFGSLPAFMGNGRRRLADGPRRADCGGENRGERFRRSSFIGRSSATAAFLRVARAFASGVASSGRSWTARAT